MVTVYQDKDHALAGERVAARARRIVKRPQMVEKTQDETILLQCCTLRESAYCVIEKPLRKTSVPPHVVHTN
jgi:hypothetical protein